MDFAYFDLKLLIDQPLREDEVDLFEYSVNFSLDGVSESISLEIPLKFFALAKWTKKPKKWQEYAEEACQGLEVLNTRPGSVEQFRGPKGTIVTIDVHNPFELVVFSKKQGRFEIIWAISNDGSSFYLADVDEQGRVCLLIHEVYFGSPKHFHKAGFLTVKEISYMERRNMYVADLPLSESIKRKEDSNIGQLLAKIFP